MNHDHFYLEIGPVGANLQLIDIWGSIGQLRAREPSSHYEGILTVAIRGDILKLEQRGNVVNLTLKLHL